MQYELPPRLLCLNLADSRQSAIEGLDLIHKIIVITLLYRNGTMDIADTAHHTTVSLHIRKIA